MKKILFLLLLLAPLFANAQYWYKADAMRFKFGNNLEEWEKCNLRVYVDKSNNIKIFSLNNSINIRSVNDDYTLKEDERGNSRLSWVCVDEEGEKWLEEYDDKYASLLGKIGAGEAKVDVLGKIQIKGGVTDGAALVDAYYNWRDPHYSDDLKEFLEGRLTQYMVPTVFMQIDEMPQTPNGKTDLKKLPEPQLRLTLTLPETETEIRLHEIASSISKTKEFGTTDDLYAVGFTSLTLMKLNARIYEEMGVNLDIISLLNDPTIKNIANEIENNDILDLDDVIELAKDMEYYPLTENQMGIYYECIQSGDVAQYNLPSIIRFDGEIDADRLSEAIIKTIEAYPYLKTRIVLEKSKVMLKRDDSIAIDDIPIVSVDDISDEEIEKENLKLFDLHNDQLFRFKIYKTPGETILFSDVHHIISDGESLDMLFTNISNAYQGIEIEKETINGYINSIIESENENSEKYELSRQFFHDKLTQEVDSTVLAPNLNGNFEDGILKSISKNKSLTAPPTI